MQIQFSDTITDSLNQTKKLFKNLPSQRTNELLFARKFPLHVTIVGTFRDVYVPLENSVFLSLKFSSLSDGHLNYFISAVFGRDKQKWT